MNTKLSVRQIQLALYNSPLFNKRSDTMATNISWGLLNHEADFVSMNRSGYLTEVEIKRSWEDFKADFKKDHEHKDERVYRFFYCVPEGILEKVKDRFVFPVEWGVDLQSEHERYLTEEVFKKPVFLKNYPKDIKAFYMRQNDDGRTVAAVDMLVPGIGELCGGSQREERLDVLKKRINELGLKESDYSWYLDTRRYGTNVHSGYGLGFERLVMYLTGISNIRDVEFFPRAVGSIIG